MGFKISNDVLDIITDLLSSKEHNKLKDIIPIEFYNLTKDIKNMKLKKEFVKLNEILQHNSNVYANINILSNALILRKLNSFYFPIFIDWKGRYYPRTSSFSYQGGDLSKSLLLFNKGVSINEKGVKRLKLYLAECYGHTSKKSYLNAIK
nr:hypothetical protein [Ceratocystis fimbriata]WPM94765.1 hypothetical protein [Ceratocystis fimbriata]